MLYVMQMLSILGLLCAVVVLGVVITQVFVFQDNTSAVTGSLRQLINGMTVYYIALVAFVALILFASIVVLIVSHLR